MAKPTPGPWFWVNESYELWDQEDSPLPKYGDRSLMSEEGTIVIGARIDHREFDYMEPFEENKRLIAAAPDLLEACRGVVENSRFDHTDMMRIRAAIAKATGGE